MLDCENVYLIMLSEKLFNLLIKQNSLYLMFIFFKSRYS